jgi:hypothetical protein
MPSYLKQQYAIELKHSDTLFAFLEIPNRGIQGKAWFLFKYSLCWVCFFNTVVTLYEPPT